jgi:hypothetical protein
MGNGEQGSRICSLLEYERNKNTIAKSMALILAIISFSIPMTLWTLSENCLFMSIWLYHIMNKGAR